MYRLSLLFLLFGIIFFTNQAFTTQVRPKIGTIKVTYENQRIKQASVDKKQSIFFSYDALLRLEFIQINRVGEIQIVWKSSNLYALKSSNRVSLVQLEELMDLILSQITQQGVTLAPQHLSNLLQIQKYLQKKFNHK